MGCVGTKNKGVNPPKRHAKLADRQSFIEENEEGLEKRVSVTMDELE